MKTIISLFVLLLALSADQASAHRRGGVSFSFDVPIVVGPVYPAYRYYPPSYPYYSPRYYYPPPAVYYQEPLPQQQYVPVPDVSLERAPEFIYSPELGFFVSIGIPYDIVYNGNSYYIFSGGYWYRGYYYNGPWEIVTTSNLPGILLKNRIDQIRYQRDMELRRYETERERYSGQFHRPEYQDYYRR